MKLILVVSFEHENELEQFELDKLEQNLVKIRLIV